MIPDVKPFGEAYTDGDYITLPDFFAPFQYAINEREAAVHGFPKAPYIPPKELDLVGVRDGPYESFSFPETGETYRGSIFVQPERFTWQWAQRRAEELAHKFVDDGATAETAWNLDPAKGLIGTRNDLYSTAPKIPSINPSLQENYKRWPGARGWMRVFTRWITRKDLPGIPGQRARMIVGTIDAAGNQIGFGTWETDADTMAEWKSRQPPAVGVSGNEYFGFPFARVTIGADTQFPFSKVIIPPIADPDEPRRNAGLVYECFAYGDWRVAGSFDPQGFQVDGDGTPVYPDDVVKFTDDDPFNFGRIVNDDSIGAWIPNQIQGALKTMHKTAPGAFDGWIGSGGAPFSSGIDRYNLYKFYRATGKNEQDATAAARYAQWVDTNVSWWEGGDGDVTYAEAWIATHLEPYQFATYQTAANINEEYQTVQTMWGTNVPEFNDAPDRFHVSTTRWRASYQQYGTPGIADNPFINFGNSYQSPRSTILITESLNRWGIAASRTRSHPIIYNAGLIGKNKNVSIVVVAGGCSGGDPIKPNVDANAKHNPTTLDSFSLTGSEQTGKLFTPANTFPDQWCGYTLADVITAFAVTKDANGNLQPLPGWEAAGMKIQNTKVANEWSIQFASAIIDWTDAFLYK